MTNTEFKDVIEEVGELSKRLYTLEGYLPEEYVDLRQALLDAADDLSTAVIVEG